jgi:hypothetical protein
MTGLLPCMNLAGCPPQLPPFGRRSPAPYAVGDVLVDRILETLVAHCAKRAHRPGPISALSMLREPPVRMVRTPGTGAVALPRPVAPHVTDGKPAPIARLGAKGLASSPSRRRMATCAATRWNSFVWRSSFRWRRETHTASPRSPAAGCSSGPSPARPLPCEGQRRAFARRARGAVRARKRVQLRRAEGD